MLYLLCLCVPVIVGCSALDETRSRMKWMIIYLLTKPINAPKLYFFYCYPFSRLFYSSFLSLFLLICSLAEMSKCFPAPLKQLSKYAPIIHVMKVCYFFVSKFVYDMKFGMIFSTITL